MRKIKIRLLSLNDWGNIFTIILGLASLITASATIKALNIQNHIQKETLKLQQKAEQPIFNISKDLLDYDENGVYDTYVLNIYNEGATSQNVNVSITTLFECKICKQDSQKTFLFNISGYYWAQQTHQNLTGLLFRAFLVNNHSYFCDLYNSTIEKSISPEYYFISHFDLIHITYVDINGDNQSIYYKDRTLIDKNLYENIISSITNKNNPIDIEKVTFDDLVNYHDQQ